MHITAKKAASLLAAAENMSPTFTQTSELISFPTTMVKAVTLCTAMRVMGISSRIVAGSAKWLVMSEEEQGDAMLEGRQVIPYFGYELDYDEAMPVLVMANIPDNIHIWVEDSDEAIYDAGTVEVMQEFSESLGTVWPEKRKLPALIYGSQEKLAQSGWYYTRHDLATQLICNCATRLTMLAQMNPPRP